MNDNKEKMEVFIEEEITEFPIGEYRIKIVSDQPLDMKTEEGRVIYSVITEQIEHHLERVKIKVGPFWIYVSQLEKCPKMLGFEEREDEEEQS